jgi:hypothetical protein
VQVPLWKKTTLFEETLRIKRRKEITMKELLLVMLLLVPLAVSGCSTKSGSAAAGAIGGAAAGGGAYEYRLNQELKRIEEDYKAGRIDQKEYEIRKDQIQRLSLLE